MKILFRVVIIQQYDCLIILGQLTVISNYQFATVWLIEAANITVSPVITAYKKSAAASIVLYCIVLYLLCIRQIHTRLDIELVKYYIVTVTE